MAFKSFEELELYQKARELRKEIAIVCKTLPGDEKFRLVDQMLRASRSVTNQISEGFGRYHFQENIQYCRIARGSLDELHDQLNICIDENFISSEEYEALLNLKQEVRRLLNGYINYLARSKNS